MNTIYDVIIKVANKHSKRARDVLKHELSMHQIIEGISGTATLDVPHLVVHQKQNVLSMCLAIKYVDNALSIYDILWNGYQFTFDESTRIIINTLLIMQNLYHNKRVLHLDISDRNILINIGNLDVMIIDFRASRLLKSTSVIMIKAGYASPETRACFCSDIFSMGIICIDLYFRQGFKHSILTASQTEYDLKLTDWRATYVNKYSDTFYNMVSWKASDRPSSYQEILDIFTNKENQNDSNHN